MGRPINPVLWLELRLRLRFRNRKFWVVSGFFFLTLLALFLAVRGIMASQGAAAGGTVLTFESVVLLGLMMLVAAVGGAGRISQEREQRTLAGLLNTPLSAARIARGKLLGTWAFSGWFLLLALPLFLLLGLQDASLWGRIAASLAICAAGAMTVGAIGLGFSGYFRRSLASHLATGLLLLFWLGALPLLGGVYYVHLRLAQPQGGGGFAFPQAAWAFFLYHNPFVLLVSGIGPDSPDNAFRHSAWPWLLALGVWAGIVALSFWAAVRSLKRGLFERS